MSLAELMSKASRAARSARALLNDGDLDGAVNRAYYAMFHAARAALATLGVDTASSKHGTVIGLFGQHFVKDGPFPKSVGRSLNEAQELRTEADYESAGLDRQEAEKAVTDAETFVSTVGRHLQA